MSDVKVVKLVTGEELLASVTDKTDTEDAYLLEKPYVMVMGPEGIGTMPFIPYAESDEVLISRLHIVVVLEPKEAVKQQYSKMVGKIILNESRIQLAN